MLDEVRHALRRLRATPIVTLSAVACLAIGVWMTCVVTAVGRGFFRPDLGVHAAHELVQIDEPGLFVGQSGRTVCCHRGRITSRSVVDSLAARRLFAAIGFYITSGSAPIADGEDGALHAVIMSSGMMGVLGVNVALGRRFIPADDSAGAVILSDHVWRTRYGSDPAIIGRPVNLWRSRTTVPIVGVMRADFRFPRDGSRVDAYISAGVDPSRVAPMVAALARLREGSDLDEVRPRVREIAFRNVASDRETLVQWLRTGNPRYRRNLGDAPVDVRVERYYTEPIPAKTVSFVSLVIACGLAVVLIAAANVVNLLLVRGAARRHEIAVRMALGAERARIIRGLIVETGLMSTVGIVLGYLVAFWQWQLIDPGVASRDNLGHIDISTVPFALGAGLILMLVVGVWPGVRATSLDLEQVLRDTRRTGLNASPLDSILGRMVLASTAATVMLLVSAVLLGISARERANDFAAAEGKGLVSRLTLDDRQSRSRRVEVTLNVLRRLRSIAGVQFAAVGATSGEAMSGTEPIRVALEGEPVRRLQSATVLDVSDNYFDAMRIRILRGRKFSPADTRDSTNAVVISRSVASTLFGGAVPEGRRFRYWSERDSVIMDAVVLGVAEDATRGASRLQIYRAFGTLAPARVPVLVTPQMHTVLEAKDMKKTLATISDVLSSDVTRQGARARFGFPMRRYVMIGFAMFAVVGIVLAAIGTYGIVAYSVQRRTHEIGVRMALGAPQSKVTWMVVEQGLKITAGGIICGLMLSYLAARVLSSNLADVKSDYPLAMAAVIPLVLFISIVACWIPGARAGRLNAVDALRAE